MLKSLIKGLLLGLAIHSNYDFVKPKDVALEGRHPGLNHNPRQFHIGALNPAEADKLCEL